MKRSRWPWVVVPLLVAQAAMALVWLAVESGRPPESDGRPVGIVATERTTRMRQPAPALQVERPDGATGSLAAPGRPHIVHFWATWCPPCLVELPALLAWAEAGEVEVIAVSVDPGWADVERVLGGELPPPVVRADAREVRDAFGVEGLPVTFLVDGEGVMRVRLDGARDWTSADVRQALLAALVP